MIILLKIAAEAFRSLVFSPQPQNPAAQQNSDGRATTVFRAETRNSRPSQLLIIQAQNLINFRQINIYHDSYGAAATGQHIGSTVVFLLFSAGVFAYQKITAETTHHSAGEEETLSEPIAAAAAVTFTCEICADEKPLTSFRILACNHWYCSDCITKYISSQLLENNAAAISCIAAGCDEHLDPYQLRSILPENVFVRWCDALCEASIEEEDKYYCLYKDCSAFLINDSESRKEIIAQAKCPACGRCFCVTCKVQWHEGFLCEEFQKLRVDERSNEDLMLMNLAKENKWKRCPLCQIFVDRSEGCLFMKCRCGYTFCYNCGAPLKQHYCTNCKH
ncbi:hypothetical protein ABFS82_04G112800 [Erythranthe guttata]|uniref:RBR-type E3 ubiquitin transferase n=1 Tax=Erythranthe guttata TaxID=4155 RepID=A0A022QBF1_ERYGU|nr:hypothetical protein MIMGU_mgv1a018577mg [Erythranthe guttata]